MEQIKTPSAGRQRIFDLMHQTERASPKSKKAKRPVGTRDVTDIEAHAFIAEAMRSFERRAGH